MIEQALLYETVTVRRHIQRPAIRKWRLLTRARVVNIGKLRQPTGLRDKMFEVEQIAVLPRVKRMRFHYRLWRGEPAHRRARRARHDADLCRQPVIPMEKWLACLHPLPIAHHRADRENDIIFRQQAIMHHRRIWRFDAFRAGQRSCRIDEINLDNIIGDGVGEIAISNHLACGRVDFGMGGECFTLKRAAEIVNANRRQCFGIDLERLRCFFKREQLSAMPDNRRVGGAALLSGNARIICKHVAVRTEQGAVRGAF